MWKEIYPVSKMRKVIQYPNKSIKFNVCEQKMSNNDKLLVSANVSEKHRLVFPV